MSLKIPSLLIFTNLYPSSQVKILPSVKPCPSLRPRYEDSELRRFNASSQRPFSPSSRICLTDQWTNAIWQPTTEKNCVSFEICEIGDFGIFWAIFWDIFWDILGITGDSSVLPLSALSVSEPSDTCVAAASPTLDDAMAKTGDLCPNFLDKASLHVTSPEPKPQTSATSVKCCSIQVFICQ